MASGRVLTPRRIAIELLGSTVGLGLLGWIIYKAAGQQGWGRILDAEPWLIAALLGCTVASTIINGAQFWVTGRPIAPLRFLDMQWLNMTGNLLNYAPVRLGAIARVAYHMRIDRLGLLQITAWFGMIGYILMLGVGACILATLVRPAIDVAWGLLVVGQMVLGGLLTRVLVGHPLIVKHGRGIDRMLSEPAPLWGAITLRLIDLAAFAGRMAAALMILGITLPGADIVILGLVAFVAQLIPFGRLGFREFAVAYAARWLSAQGADTAGAFPWEQLALVESAGEAIIYIPGGAIALVWYRRKWKNAPRIEAD